MKQVKTIAPYDAQESKKTQVYKMFNSIAPTYDLLNRLLSFGIDKKWRKKLVKSLKQKKHDKILDVATGTGDLAFKLLDLQPKELTALDLSDKMLDIARKKQSKKQHTTSINFVVGDSENLNFADSSFDIVTCAFGVRNFENLLAGLSEMNRVTKPCGTVAILEFCQAKNKIFGKMYSFYFKKVLPFFGKLISKDAKAYKYLPESVEYFPKEKQFAALLEDAGYKNVQIKRLTNGVACLYIAEKPC